MEGDPDADVLLDLMKAWRAAFADRWVSAGEALSSMRLAVDTAAGVLSDAIKGIAGGDHTFTDKRFGRWLTKHRDVPVAGLKIIAKRNPLTKNFVYCVVCLEQPALEPPKSPAAPPASPVNAANDVSDLIGDLTPVQSVVAEEPAIGATSEVTSAVCTETPKPPVNGRADSWDLIGLSDYVQQQPTATPRREPRSNGAVARPATPGDGACSRASAGTNTRSKGT
jgi:hypothetical protein